MVAPKHQSGLLARKPGRCATVIRSPTGIWPPALAQIRCRLAGHDDGEPVRRHPDGALAEAGLDAVEAACAEALSAKLFGCDVVPNILARQRDAAPPRPVATPAALTLSIEPVADCARYDRLCGPVGRGSKFTPPAAGAHSASTRAPLPLRDARGSPPWTPGTTAPQPLVWVTIGR